MASELLSYCMPSGLEIEDDLAFQRRSWMLQRFGWAAIAVFAACGLAGLFGTGPLSAASARHPESVSLQYERFARYQAPTSLKIKFRSTGTEPAYLKIRRDYLDSMKIEKIVPEPASVKAENGSLIYVFDMNTPGELLVKFDLTAQEIGALTGAVASPSGTWLSFSQFVYP